MTRHQGSLKCTWSPTAEYLWRAVRSQSGVDRHRLRLDRSLRIGRTGADVDNDSAFINETVVSFCKSRKIKLTRSRAYKKNEPAWIEQKNGSVDRRLFGYGRLEGEASAAVLDELHRQARLYVNLLLPCFKPKSKIRVGVKVSKKYEPPATTSDS